MTGQKQVVPARSRGRVVSIDAVHPDPANTNSHDEASVGSIRASLARFGQQRPIVVSVDGTIVAGEGTWRALRELGVTTVWTVETGLDPDESAAFSVADNATSEHRAWRTDLLRERIDQAETGGIDAADMGFTAAQLERLLGPRPSDATGEEGAGEDGDAHAPGREASGAPATKRDYSSTGRVRTDSAEAAAAARERWGVEVGQVWALGNHIVACADARDERMAARLLADVAGGHLLLTDPPYCSGAFQEAGKGAGTWGAIASDSLSTRGYTALLSGTFAASRPRAAYVFTDWRMWMVLSDVVESVGIPIRSMIVWDKGHPGLGGLWRTQHELVLFGSRDKLKREEGMAGSGNVLRFGRSGNDHHYTEKPVELLAALLTADEASPRRRCVVHDPFLGSGSTLLACEHAGRVCVGTDVEPLCVAVTLERWHDMTGSSPRRLDG